MISHEREVSPGATYPDLYFGTLRHLAVGTRVDPEPFAEPELTAFLDGGRPAGLAPRSAAVSAAATARDATVIAAIRFAGAASTEPPSPVRIYRVRGEPFHTGALAVLEELARRIREGGALEALIREYWQPAGLWHVREVIAPSLRVIEEVPAASDRETYVPRWVHYREDRESARAL